MVRVAVSVALVVVLLVTWSLVSVAQGPPGGPPVIAEESREPTSDLECEMSCSPGKHTPTIELRWDPVKDKRIERRVEQRIETTVYKTGFAQGELASLPLAATGKMAAQGVKFARIDKRSTKKLPAALELTVASAEMTKTPRPRASVRAEGMEPGLTYFWRLSSRVGNTWVTSQTIRCQAPVCPVDSDLGPRTP